MTLSGIDELADVHAANRRFADANLERRLLQLRRAIFVQRRSPRQEAPVAVDVPPVGSGSTLPKTTASSLNADVLRQALCAHGALHVGGFLPASRVDDLRGIIDLALSAQESAHLGAPVEQTSPWFEPSDLVRQGPIARSFVRINGAVLAVDSPRAFFRLLDTFYDLKLDRLVAEFFGEHPAISAEKTTLRRVVPGPAQVGWHQDGRFLGTNIRSLNVWVTLTDCGVDAPGLELIPSRLQRIVPTGTEGAEYDWCVSNALVEVEFPEKAIRPTFNAGDALFFDHYLLHRTYSHAAMTKVRYAIESWFFAPSAYPETQTGLYV